MMRLTALSAAVVLAACASGPTPQDGDVVRTRAPANYENTVTSYFDLTIPGPQTGRKLVFGAPESSHCPLFGSAGTHLGWVVPVVYDTSPPAAATKGGTGAAAAKGNAAASALAVKTAAAGAAAAPADGASGVSLADVSVTGTRYFFWFSSDTLSAVTRRIDLCP
jgi:hypothetical protein